MRQSSQLKHCFPHPRKTWLPRPDQYFFMLGVLWLLACGQSERPLDPGISNPSMGVLKLSIGPVSVAPNSERTVCFTGRLQLPSPMDVVQIEAQQTESHYVSLYRYAPGSSPLVDKTPQDCLPSRLLEGAPMAPLFVGASSDSAPNVLRLAPDAAYRLAVNDYYMIALHVSNTSSEEILVTALLLLTPPPNDHINKMQV